MNKRVFIYGIIFGLAFCLFLWALFSFKASAHQEYSKTICHHTPGNNVTLTFHTPQAYQGHLGQPHSGQTYDTNGACEEVTPTPTPTVTPTPPVECEKDCEEVTPTPVEPTPTPVEGQKGNSDGDYHPSAVEAPKPPTCTISFEIARTWYDKDGLHWATDAKDIQKFSITYGADKDHLIYGIDNIPANARGIAKPKSNFKNTWFSVWTWVGGCANQSTPIDP